MMWYIYMYVVKKKMFFFKMWSVCFNVPGGVRGVHVLCKKKLTDLIS